MRKALVMLAVFSLLWLLPGCSGGGNDDDDSGVQEDAGQDAGGDQGADQGADQGQDAGGDQGADEGGSTDQDIGSACSCEGDECQQAGVPKPASGTIVGCDDVPADWTGADRVCLRTYEGPLATNTYFANGYCSLMATRCTGADLICSSAVFGDYDAMTSCPAGTVLLESSQEVDVFGQQATIGSKTCAAGCSGDDDCRGGEPDPVVDEVTQYACIDKDGVKFCYDPRNLPADYTATAFLTEQHIQSPGT